MTAPTTPSPERQPADAGGGLLPCPWCGGELYVSVQDIDNFIGHVECGGCDMRGPISEWKYEDPEEAKADAVERWNAAWNRRTPAPQAQPDARAVEALRRIERNPVSFSHAASQLARETLQALSAPAADDGWRPIETAPKDGTPVLLYPTNMTGCWDFGAEDWLVFVIPLNKDKSIAADWQTMPPMMFEVSAGLMCAEPTHWRALPAPPVALHPAAPTDEVGKS